jgi:hypothetical protein
MESIEGTISIGCIEDTKFPLDASEVQMSISQQKLPQDIPQNNFNICLHIEGVEMRRMAVFTMDRQLSNKRMK